MKLTILAATICALAAVTSPVSAQSQSGPPVAAYAFSEGTGTTTADSSGNGNTATLMNGPTWTTGVFGNAVAFADTSQWVQVTASETLQLTTAFTIEGWVYPTTTGFFPIWSQGTTVGDRWLAVQNGYPAFVASLTTGYAGVWSPTTVPLNTWTHVAVTYDGTILHLYVNGTEVNSLADTFSLPSSLQPITLGPIVGALDEVRLYRTALTASEVALDSLTALDASSPFQVSFQTPANGAIGILTTPITAGFSRAADGSTVTTSTFELRDSSHKLVTATVGYDPTTDRATLTPTSAPTPLTDYTARVVGGTGGVTDGNGQALASDVTWTFRTAAAATDPVASYAFSEGTGTTTADDSGNGNTAALMNGPTWTTGVFGNAVAFANTSQWVEVTPGETLQLTTAFTIEGWVYPTMTGFFPIWAQGTTVGDRWLAVQNGYPAFVASLTTGYAGVWSPTTVPLNTWTHVAVTYDGAILHLYVNGTEVNSLVDTFSLPSSLQPITLGPVVGALDEVRLYRTALTASEVARDRDAAIVATNAAINAPNAAKKAHPSHPAHPK